MVHESITATVNIEIQIWEVLPLVGSIRSYRSEYAIWLGITLIGTSVEVKITNENGKDLHIS